MTPAYVEIENQERGGCVSRLVAVYKSSLGKKLIVAVTGIFMLGFLLGHVTGNLKVFLPDTAEGEPDIDHYAESLRIIGDPFLPHNSFLWVARAVLILALVLHVICVIQLASMNRAARPQGYEKQSFAQASMPARWMLLTGIYLLLFIVFHILHFTLGAFGDFEYGKVYQNLQVSFGRIGYVALYVFSMIVLAIHLYHGTWSLFQTLGWTIPTGIAFCVDWQRPCRWACCLVLSPFRFHLSRVS